MTSGDFESALGKFRSDAAADVLRQAIRNLETKFDPNQPRAPVGSSNGGQWVDTGRGGGGGGKVRRPLKAGPRPKARSLARMVGFLASHPEAAPIVQAAGLPALAGGVALTRALGDFDQRTTGGEKTPFLNLPTEKLDLRGPEPQLMSRKRKSRKPKRLGTFYPYHPFPEHGDPDECLEIAKADRIKCKTYRGMYGRTQEARVVIEAICRKTVMERYSECLAGGPGAVRTLLFDGRQ